MGDRYFDLAQLRGQQRGRRGRGPTLLDAYFGEPADPRRSRRLRLMRFMSDFREAMWGVVQSGVSELDFDFDGLRVQALRPHAGDRRRPAFERWLEEARGAGG